MRACLLLALIAIAVAAVSCGDGSPTASHPAHAKVTLAERKAIFNDWYADGRIDGVYSCAVVQNAISHLPADPPTDSTVFQDFQRYERGVCR